MYTGLRSHNPYDVQILPNARPDLVAPYAWALFDDPAFRDLASRIQEICAHLLDPDVREVQKIIDRQALQKLIISSEASHGSQARELLQDRVAFAEIDIVGDSEAQKRVEENRRCIRKVINKIRVFGCQGHFRKAAEMYCGTRPFGLLMCPKVPGTYLRTLITKQKWNCSVPDVRQAILAEADEVYRTAAYYLLMNPYIQKLYDEIYANNDNATYKCPSQ